MRVNLATIAILFVLTFESSQGIFHCVRSIRIWDLFKYKHNVQIMQLPNKLLKNMYLYI